MLMFILKLYQHIPNFYKIKKINIHDKRKKIISIKKNKFHHYIYIYSDFAKNNFQERKT